ncbi:pro-sigmaK processing inhibitor BofA family protein [Clostridium sp. D2Q-11]|uniref:Pro-sigmaK processing inhibitor BofA family protein n=1 Tax=Anaeromonas frigoriresistens TaxID=2683708 RepID=A0A942UYH7_9FIRM|nr:pro-sigmaK processing inhibitor BofA family protein [Anaeromonas frigoriresistens]MBS4537942.1 pro-sigmaK processing inhibitor BofA family protein [Anaeromonas frigoriresistens]
MFSGMPIYIPIIIIVLLLLGFISILSAIKIRKFVLHSILGILLLFLYNIFLSGFTGIYVGINIVTVLVVAILGMPGFVLLLVLNLIL